MFWITTDEFGKGRFEGQICKENTFDLLYKSEMNLRRLDLTTKGSRRGNVIVDCGCGLRI